MTRLFTPFSLGPIALGHRVVMAPLTRSRSTQPGDVPSALMRTYYAQRASEGGLIISEATVISPTARGWQGAPGLYDDRQVEGWRQITDAVHARGGVMVSQLWHTGRVSHVSMTGGASPVAPSVDPAFPGSGAARVSTQAGWTAPSPHRALSTDEIPAVVEEYRRAAIRAREAGFDAVELHGANGYLPDQFLQDGSNRRDDAYGGSIANRMRFLLEVTAALVSVWGADRVGVRIGPGGRFNGMSDSDPDALFGHVASALAALGIAYLHVIEPRVRGSELVAEGQGAVAAGRLRRLFSGSLIAAGGFTPASAEAVIEAGDADLVAFGRLFVSNPDLPRRIAVGAELAAYDRSTFYTFDERGYTDYPALERGLCPRARRTLGPMARAPRARRG